MSTSAAPGSAPAYARNASISPTVQPPLNNSESGKLSPTSRTVAESQSPSINDVAATKKHTTVNQLPSSVNNRLALGGA